MPSLFFDAEQVSGQNQLKASVQRGIRSRLQEDFNILEEILDQILPKKQNLTQVKCRGQINLLTADGSSILFAQAEDSPFIPTLKEILMLNKDPGMLPKVTVDRGAIKFVLSGANIMCPGLTSKGGSLPEENLPEGTVVAVHAEGKEHPLAIGILKLSTDDIKKVNSGIGIDTFCYLNDPLWNLML
ncbi:putative CHP00451 domain-containing protein [Rozella allomycis CSF55]|uniref:Translation machinery-associated protein 20 n=1 Tax=Rozella allomycis (strain CSF55) TaxID=988480 RepID=A0A075AUK9_ROZAC|nr:putative CHP00451 domain-containing protein [Rozella allomycis CSF55]|eukprot:EPZ32407.1 putative CHP00451 domain-containing protein [Rozella allomycis CSF55]